MGQTLKQKQNLGSVRQTFIIVRVLSAGHWIRGWKAVLTEQGVVLPLRVSVKEKPHIDYFTVGAWRVGRR